AGAVTVTSVFWQCWQRIDADVDGALGLAGLRTALADLLEHVGELVAEEDRDDGWRRFVCTQTVIVAGTGNHSTQELGVEADGADYSTAENEELGLGVRRVTWIEQVALCGV